MAGNTIDGIGIARFFIIDNSIRNKLFLIQIKLIMLLWIEIYSETRGISSNFPVGFIIWRYFVLLEIWIDLYGFFFKLALI
jgi:hypothetical protein